MAKKESQSPLPPKAKPSAFVSFPVAMQAIMDGKKIRRAEWADKNEYGLIKDSYVTIHRNEKFFAWMLSEGDVLATDWIIE